MFSFNRLPGQRRQIAVIEPSAVWRHWIDRVVRPTPDVDLAIFESVRSLWLALGPRPADLVILAYRMPGFDTYAWINDNRRRAASASACRIVALVNPIDMVGSSMAKLAGADGVYRRGADEQALRVDLAAWAGAAAVQHDPGPGWQEAVPLFDPRAVVVSKLLESQRRVVFNFLDALPRDIELLRSWFGNSGAHAADELAAFARYCLQAGAMRAGEYAELLAARVQAGRGLRDELMLEQFRILDQTTREMVAWLLKGDRSDQSVCTWVGRPSSNRPVSS